MLGDFNQIACSSEKLGENQHSIRKMEAFKDFWDDCNLSDLGCNGLRFTWSNMRRTALQLNPPWVLLPNKTFKLEPMWYLKSSFKSLVNNAWSSNSYTFLVNLKSLSQQIGSWDESSFGNIFMEKSLLTKIISGIEKTVESHPNFSNLWSHFKYIHSDLDSILLKEEEFWRTRARDSLLQGGDNNTTFFHQSVLIRRKRNRMDSIHDPQRVLTFDPNQIANIFQSFFCSLFTSQQTSAPLSSHSPSLSLVISISSIPSLTEIKKSSLFPSSS